MTNIRIRPDLESHIRKMLPSDGIGFDYLINHFLERGIIHEVSNVMDEDLAHEFAVDLIAKGEPNWDIIECAPGCENCGKKLANPGIDMRGWSGDPESPAVYCDSECHNEHHGFPKGTRMIPVPYRND